MLSFLLGCLQPLATIASGLGKDKKLFILIYHQVLDEADFMRPGEVDKQAFTWQMALLSRYFNVLPLPEALAGLQQGTLPPRAVTITFDDGYADNLHNAVPILKSFGLSATFFIASGYLDGGRMWNDTVIEAVRACSLPQLDLTAIGLTSYDIDTPQKKRAAAQQIIKAIKHLPYPQRLECTRYLEQQVQSLPDDLMLTSEQLIQLQKSGMEIGGHTVSHPIMAKLAAADAKAEVLDNQLFLQQLLATKLRYFAYPNGKPGDDYLPEHRQLIADCGYQAAFSTRWGVADKHSDIWQLPRFTPWDTTPLRFMLRLIRMYKSGN